MSGRVIATCFQVSLFSCLLAVALAPVLTLTIRDDTGARLFCAGITHGDEIRYQSINSIYRVPVEEYLRVMDDGALVAVQVVSTPAVIYYYGIESFTPRADGQVSAVPRATLYREVRLKIGRRGQQYLVVAEAKIALYEIVAEGEAITLAVQNAPRILACR